MKKKYILLSTLPFSFTFLTGCNETTTPKTPSYTPEVIKYTKIPSVEHKGYLLKKGEFLTIDINCVSKHNDYLRLDIRTDINLKGKYKYSDIHDLNHTIEESIFIEKCEQRTQFCHFLDAFRPATLNHASCGAKQAHPIYDIPEVTEMAHGLFEKQIESLTLTNVSDEDGSFVIYAFYVSDRKLPMEEVYLSNGSIKLGTDLMGGGTLTYLEKLYYKTSKKDYYIDEVITPDNSVYIGVDAHKIASEGGVEGSTDHHVNLINYYDAGRQIQQSFYSDVGGSKEKTEGENGYTRWMCFTADPSGYYWPYNPVQGGDCHCNISQISDYRRTENSIYIRCKPLDWAGNNYVTDSYMENWYSIENDVVTVKNRFVNFAGFTDQIHLDAHGLELPATYIAHPLNTLVTYQGESPWTEDKTGLIYQDNLGPWKDGADVINKHPEDWFAWVNEDRFGVGMYIPEVTIFASGRSSSSKNVTESKNVDAFDSPMGNTNKLRYNKKEAYYNFQSCYTRNTDYTAPEISTVMVDYVPFEYSYALCVDYLDVIRNNFKNLYKNKKIDNKSMNLWNEYVQEHK